MDGVWQDIRFALRMLSRRPGLTAAALLTLALGLGVNTAVFSVIRGVLLRPLPYPHADRLVSFWYHSQGRRTPTISQPELLDLQSKLASVDSAAGALLRRVHLGGDEEPRLVRTLDGTAELMPLLGVAPARGRFFTAEESAPGGADVAVVSSRLWHQLFPDRAGIAGADLVLDGRHHAVVGVMPPGFAFPDPDVDVYRPFRIDRASPDERNDHYLWVVGRLRPGASLATACSELASYSRWAVAEYPEFYSGFNASFTVTSLRETIIGTARTPLILLLGASFLVLLIACTNVASLLLAHGEERRQEAAVRLALGAGRGRLARQLVVESIVLGLLGLALAVPFAGLTLRSLIAVAGDALPRTNEVSIDLPVLVYASAIALATGLLFGLAPLLKAWRGNLRGGLFSGVRTVSANRTGVTLYRVLVAAQVALAVVLVLGTGLLTRTIAALEATDVGFDTDRSVAVRVSLPQHVFATSADIASFVRGVEEEALRLPGVTAAGIVESMPLMGTGLNNLSLQVEGHVVETVGEAPTAIVQGLTAGGVAALGLELVRGRSFTARDVAEGRHVALVNEAFVARVLAGADPASTRVRMFVSSRPWLEIVGVVRDFRQGEVIENAWPQLIVPFELEDRNAYRMPRDFTLVVRSAAGPSALAEPLRRIIRELGPAVAIREVRTLTDARRSAMGERPLLTSLLTVSSALALILAGLGIYGVVSLAVSRRRREIGLRMALGAGPGSVGKLVLRQAGAPVLVGLVVGLMLAVMMATWIRALLYGVTPTDPVSVAGVAVALVATTLAAIVHPVRRALSVDPAHALRTE